jgi:hypothetical protein
MKKTLSALIALLMALTFAAPTAQAKIFDSFAYREILNAYSSAAAAYNDHPTDTTFSAAYYAYYAAYYFYLGVAYNNDTYRFYGYVYAYYSFTFAADGQANSPNDTSTLAQDLYAAYFHSYFAYYFAYWASAGF